MSVITFSTEFGSGGRNIARSVAEKLNYQYIDREIIREAGKKYSVPEKKLEEVFTKNPGIIERLIEDQSIYLTFIENIILKFASEDNVIIAGSGGQYILRDISHVLKVRVIAPVPFRVEKIMERENLDRKQAEEMVAKEDKNRMLRMNHLFKINWSDPSLYDIVINTRNIFHESAVEMIANMVKQKGFQPGEESKKLLDDLLLTSKIKAKLASHPMIMMSYIDIATKEGIVTITGNISNIYEKELIIENVKEIAGDKYVDNLALVHPPQGDLF
jgi:cytidylate kinase